MFFVSSVNTECVYEDVLYTCHLCDEKWKNRINIDWRCTKDQYSDLRIFCIQAKKFFFSSFRRIFIHFYVPDSKWMPHVENLMMQILFAKLWYVQRSIDVFLKQKFSISFFAYRSTRFLFGIFLRREREREGNQKERREKWISNFVLWNIVVYYSFLFHYCPECLIWCMEMWSEIDFQGKKYFVWSYYMRMANGIWVQLAQHIVAMLLINPKLLIEMKEKQIPLALSFEWRSWREHFKWHWFGIYTHFVWMEICCWSRIIDALCSTKLHA